MQLKYTFRKATEISFVIVAIVALSISGCGGGGGSSNVGGATIPTTTTSVTPFKGPFYSGASVSLRDANGNSVPLASGGIINASGVASVTYNSNVIYPLIVEVSGTYYNESTGGPETSSVPLRGLIQNASAAAATSGVPVTFVTEIAVADLQNRLGGFSSAHPIQPMSAVSSMSTAGKLAGVPANTVPVFDSTTHRTNDSDTLLLAAWAVVANGQVGTSLADKVRSLAHNFVINSTSAPSAITSQATYDSALVVAASNVWAVGAGVIPAAPSISNTSFNTLYASSVAELGLPPQGLWKGRTDTNRYVTSLVFNDGSYYSFYSQVGQPNQLAGVIQGSGSSANGNFSSTNTKDFNFETRSVSSTSLSTSYSAKQYLNGSLTYAGGMPTSFTSRYDANFEAPASLSTLAGAYSGSVEHSLGSQNSIIAISTSGVISGSVSGCSITGLASPRTDGNSYNLTLTFGGNACYYSISNKSFSGIGYIDSGSKALYVAAPNSTRSDGIAFVGARNTAPIANAGTAQSIINPSQWFPPLVTLDGSASSDVDGDPLTYNWVLISKPSTSAAQIQPWDNRLVNSSFNADVEGTYVATLTVNDGKENSLPATVTITATSVINPLPIGSGTIVSGFYGNYLVDENTGLLTLLPSLRGGGYGILDLMTDGRVVSLPYFGAQSLLEVDVMTGAYRDLFTLPEPMMAFAIAPDGTIVAISSAASFGLNQLYRFTPQGALLGKIAISGGSRSLDFGAAGSLYMFSGAGLVLIDPITGSQTSMFRTFESLYGDFDIDSAGTLRIVGGCPAPIGAMCLKRLSPVTPQSNSITQSNYTVVERSIISVNNSVVRR